MQRWKNAIAVVTGANSGIGKATVKEMVKAGLKVCALDIRLDRLEKMRDKLPEKQQKNLYNMCCDVTDKCAVNETFDKIEEELCGIDILFNNAGILIPGQLLTMDTEKIQRIVQTNIMGVIYCTQRGFKSMKERGVDGHILITNSVLGHDTFVQKSGPPDNNIYPATKFAITAINELMRQELNALGTKIKITSVSPGLVDTDIVSESLKAEAAGLMLKPEAIASGVMYAISTKPGVQIHEITIKPVGETFI